MAWSPGIHSQAYQGPDQALGVYTLLCVLLWLRQAQSFQLVIRVTREHFLWKRLSEVNQVFVRIVL